MSSARTYAASLHSGVGIKERVESWKIAPERDYYRDQFFFRRIAILMEYDIPVWNMD
jgi:hypothetical protein